MPSLNTGNAILSNALKVDSSYNVGIGTSTPFNSVGYTVLDLYGSSVGGHFLVRSPNVTAEYLANDILGEAYIGTRTNHPIIFRTNTTTRLTIAATGAATFSSSVTANSSITLIGGNATNNTENAIAQLYDANSNLMGRIVGYRGANGNEGNLRIYTNNVTPTLAMTLTNTGNVGIGTSSPNFNGFSTALTINGTTGATPSAGFELSTSGTNRSYIGADANSMFIVTRTNIPMAFYTNDTERMRITTDGAPKFRIAGAALRDTNGVVPEISQAANVHCLVLSQKTSDFSQDGFGVLGIAVDRAATAGYAFAGWYSSITGDKEFSFRGDGNGYCDGSWTGGGADYAEYFEWEDGNINNEDRRGMSVSLVNNKIKIAEQGESIIGVISGNASIVGDAAWNKWSGKYLKDDFGSYILDEKGNRTLNPDYDENAEYIPREKRKEWSVVGLMGKLRIKKGQATMPTWIKMRDISQNVEEWLIK